MLKIRKDNQFTWAWAITRDGQAIDLTTATNLKYKYQIKDQSGRVDILSYTKTGNIISTVFLPTQPGIYNLLLTFDLPADGPCAVDVDAFEIVKSSEEASDASEFTVTSEMAIGFTGKNAYEVWLDTHEGTLAEYEAWLKQPAADAASSVALIEEAIEQNELIRLESEINRGTAEGLRAEAEQDRISAEGLRLIAEYDRADAESIRAGSETARDTAEGLRVQAETGRSTAEGARVTAESGRVTTEGLRVTAEGNRVTAESGRVTAEGLRVTAENGRESAEGIRNTKEGERQTKEAERIAAEINRQPSIINNEQVQAETYNVLNARIAALETLLANGIYGTSTIDKVEVVNEFNIHGITNLILKGTTAPSITPDFIGQTYINTTAGTTYTAKGITNSGDWKQTSN